MGLRDMQIMQPRLPIHFSQDTQLSLRDWSSPLWSCRPNFVSCDDLLEEEHQENGREHSDTDVTPGIHLGFNEIFSDGTGGVTYTIEVENDPNALNKSVHVRLPANYLTFGEIISLWEKKIGKTLEKTYVTEEQVLKDIKGQ
ncbi:hypothetical protein Fmac_010455 [Flemingia macrophylla]|uniref:NmrA-like domain-containing protein n=1 Tax=Flemingia macrophylla TaxID=520843 RepID=A0ABD1MJN1_9FABA